jgi:hypothetical protein
MTEALVNAVEVALDGAPVGIFVPPLGQPFTVFVGNIPRSYMRVQVLSGTKRESWSWQLPDVRLGQVLSLRMVEAAVGSGRPPGSISPRSTERQGTTRKLKGRRRAPAIRKPRPRGR